MKGYEVRRSGYAEGGAGPVPRTPYPVPLADLLPAETDSPEATQALGRALAARLAPGDVVALTGDLGAGKTHLAKGVAEGLGLDPDAVTSPTFTLVHEHDGGRLLHLDLYRVETAAEAARLGLEELMSGDAVALVEWPEHAHGLLPPGTLWLRLAHLGRDRRRIESVQIDV